MNNIYLRSLVLFLSFFSILYGKGKDKIEPIPAPQYITYSEGKYYFKNSITLVFEKFQGRSHFFKDEIHKEWEQRFSKNLRIKITNNKPNSDYIFFGSLTTNEEAWQLKELIREYNLLEKEEGYVLRVSKNHIAILANTSKGAYYGLVSLFQLIQQDKKELYIDNCLIADYPNFVIRGISDDLARGQVSTLQDFKKIIRLISRYKLNTYQPYFEDAIEIKSFPDIGLNRGRLTQVELRELVAYGEKYFVEIIPIFQTLGHWENLLIQPAYQHLADFPGAASLDVTSNATYDFLDKCIGELSKIFPSKYFHAGLDESWDIGLGKSKALTQEFGKAKVHAEHYKKVNEIVKKYGKQMMMYGDIIHDLPEIFEMLPKDIIVVDWRYGLYDYEYIVKKYNDYNQPFICSPSVTNYNRIFPYITNSLLNILFFTRTAYEYGSLGCINSNWGDNGGENFREFNWLGYAFGAECSWNPLNADIEKFKTKFYRDFYGINKIELDVIYSLLSDFGANFSQYDFWRNPFIKWNSSEDGYKMTINYQEQNIPILAMSIKTKGKNVLELINELKPNLLYQKDHLDYFAFAAKQGIWYGNKLIYSMRIKNLVNKKNGFLSKEDREEVDKLCDEMISNLIALKKEFRELWLRTNSEENLWLIEKEKYDRQIFAWKAMKVALKQEIVEYDQTLKSPWIYHPEAHPGERNQTQVKEALFTKQIFVKDSVQSAIVHLMAESFAELYVNGKFIGDVRGRRTLSLWVESQRAKFFDISNYLKDGVNEIKIIAKNFGENVSAGINVQIDLKTKTSHSRIYTDESWKVYKLIDNKWDEKYVSTKIVKTNIIASEPNFEIGITSWRER